jgi:cyclohexyl-isocyanide hydratase
MEHSPYRARSLDIGFLIYPDVTLLDVVGPLEVLARLPGAQSWLIANEKGPIQSDNGCALVADSSFADRLSLDLLVVPGGPGVDLVIEDDAYVKFVRSAAERCRSIASVCTGAFLLGAAGCLRGRRATTHWRYLELLRMFGAEPVALRVVRDGNVVTAAGVSAGIDMALSLAAGIAGEEEAARIALILEYDPAPPVRGSRAASTPEILADVTASTVHRYERRAAIIERAAAKMGAAAM